MASIKKRGNAYEITVSMGRSSDGKKLFKTTTYKPEALTPKAIEKELDNFAHEFEKRVKEGKYTSGETTTFSDFVKIWEQDWAVHKITESVLESYTRVLRVRILPTLGGIRMAKILPVHIQNLITAEIKKGHSVATIKYTFCVISSIMRYAYRMGVILENPCLRCELPKAKKKDELHYFDVEQSKLFLAALDMKFPVKHTGHRRVLKKTGDEYLVPAYIEYVQVPLQFKVYFYLAVYGGFRRGELIALTWNDVDFLKNSISINKAVANTSSGQKIKEPKTIAGVREIMLPPECFDLLASWRKEQLHLALTLGSAWQGYRGTDFNKNYIFIQPDSGLMMDLNTPTHKFHEILNYYNSTCATEESKLPLIRLHDLRHTSATLLLAHNVDVETVAHRLGHSRPSVTLDIYGHAMKKMDEKASSVLKDMLS